MMRCFNEITSSTICIYTKKNCVQIFLRLLHETLETFRHAQIFRRKLNLLQQLILNKFTITSLQFIVVGTSDQIRVVPKIKTAKFERSFILIDPTWEQAG